MFNKQNGLNALERLFKNEEDFLTLEMLFGLTHDSIMDVLEKHFEKENDVILKDIIEFSPNIMKNYINDSWVEYSAKIQYDNRKIGYVNRAKKLVILDNDTDSLIEKLNRTLAFSMFSVLQIDLENEEEYIEFTQLNEYSVITTKTIRKKYTDMKLRATNKFVEEYEEQIILSLTDESREEVERSLFRTFVNDNYVLDTLDYTSFIHPTRMVKNKIMSMYEVLNGKLLFEFIENESIFELIYEDLLHKNFFGDEQDITTLELKKQLYRKRLVETQKERLEKEYNAVLAREIVRGLVNGGQNVTIKKIGADETVKVGNNYAIIGENMRLGKFYHSGVDYKEIQTITFGRKTLFDLEVFNENYGHLKSTI